MTARRAAWLAAWLLLLAAAPAAQGQQPSGSDTTAARYGSGIGAEIVLTNSGFGLGGYLRYRFEPGTSALLEIHLAPGKDPREASFFDRFGQRDIPRKAHYLLIAPVHVGFQYRLFADRIEDNFRPFVQLAAGPAFGWAYPYFEDENGNEQLDEGERVYGTFAALQRGEPRTGVSAVLAVGAFFGEGRRAARGVRVGYEATYFFRGVQLLEPQVQPARRFFGTPTISLIFGRLW